MSELTKLRLTAYPTGLASFLVDSNAEIKSSNYTVIINVNSVKTVFSSLAVFVPTLPTIATGTPITFVNMVIDGQDDYGISPAPLDGITLSLMPISAPTS